MTRGRLPSNHPCFLGAAGVLNLFPDRKQITKVPDAFLRIATAAASLCLLADEQ